MKKILAISILMLAFSAGIFAQATATASAVIVAPISIAQTADMNFGNIIAGAGAGTVVLTPGGVRTPTGVTFPSVGGTVAAASFTVTGLSGATYAITLPLTHNIVSGANSMTVNAFTSNPSGTGTLTGGTEILNVGATLNVGAAQPAGAYTSATGFTVTVNYN
ncbi:MAG: DUF4402 domain-containing protein [Bacteroidales bacterium]|nr:DUF4402 domain-containing protein [Bacteroidales bacterium]